MARGVALALTALVAMGALNGCRGDRASDEGRTPSAARTSSTTTTTTTVKVDFRTDRGALAPADAIRVSMKDYKFLPATLRASSTGFRVALTNDEIVCSAPTCRAADSAHDLVILNGATGLPLARSERLLPGESALFVVDRLAEGTYRFFCTLHVRASMEGTLEVTS